MSFSHLFQKDRNLNKRTTTDFVQCVVGHLQFPGSLPTVKAQMNVNRTQLEPTKLVVPEKPNLETTSSTLSETPTLLVITEEKPTVPNLPGSKRPITFTGSLPHGVKRRRTEQQILPAEVSRDEN
eukprot:TRINITY_DN5134_c0_g1_i1.p1 TRINITY_DN5134_c0_g1~~TRINITY_DN5134_c0_g1_i1.p1  ORF type:complete len:125 (-),score=29.16 TRINITY_DN5134_c0_g1_i1:519-893(-)